MKQTRRDFLKKLPLAASIPFTIGGIPIRSMAENTFTKMARASADNDRVLIILQMHGGNDGLNTLIPVDAYDLYYEKRRNIAIPAKNNSRKYIPLDSTLPLDAQVGLHPDMTAIKGLYDQGKVSIVQGVSYKNNNGSHFRGRDIWFMGGSYEDYYPSGWVGRYFQEELKDKNLSYPEDFPNDAMPDPLALEMGSDVSLIFHQKGNIPTSISINDPKGFAELVEELEGFVDIDADPRGIPPSHLENSPYYNELDWILSLEDKSKDYSQRLYEVWKAGGESSVSYPENYPFNAPLSSYRNQLSPQLRLIARMLAGGCKTKVFLVKIGGFDTHAEQVESYNSTMGAHAALLYHISSAMKVFQDDLKARGLEDRVLTVTTSEFGRRVDSNGSYGTDHGTGGPIFIFGRGAAPGVVGKSPDLTKSNVQMQYDYRNIYGNIMRDWMLVSDERLNQVFPDLMSPEGTKDGVKFEQLNLAQKTITSNDQFLSSRFALMDCYPNPAIDRTIIRFRINTSNNVTVNLFDGRGNLVKQLMRSYKEAGEHVEEVSLADIPSGQYVYQLKSGAFTESKKLVIYK